MARLDQLVARNFGLNRRQAQIAIARGQVQQSDGEKWPTKPFPDVLAPVDVRWRGQPCQLHDRMTVVQHKPLNVVTSREDPHHPTAYALLRHLPLFDELVAVGRLDVDATGLLFWTNDGDLVHRLTHPKRRVQRTYHVALARAFTTPPALLQLRDGYVPEIDALSPLLATDVHPALIANEPAEHFASITLHAGAYHEVKRIFAALGSHVVGLCRVAYAGFELPHDLAPGSASMLDTDTVAHLR